PRESGPSPPRASSGPRIRYSIPCPPDAAGRAPFRCPFSARPESRASDAARRTSTVWTSTGLVNRGRGGSAGSSRRPWFPRSSDVVQSARVEDEGVRRLSILAGLFAAGVLAAHAVAKPQPGKGKPRPTVTSAKTGGKSHGAKVVLCHRTGSKAHPYVKVTVAASALGAHLKHG